MESADSLGIVLMHCNDSMKKENRIITSDNLKSLEEQIVKKYVQLYWVVLFYLERLCFHAS